MGWDQSTIYSFDIVRSVPSVLIQLDEPTFQALNQIAPAAKRQRAEFIRQAIRAEIRKREFARMREAYRKHPDSEAPDDWSNCEEFRE
jgi:hypothetical protein